MLSRVIQPQTGVKLVRPLATVAFQTKVPIDVEQDAFQGKFNANFPAPETTEGILDSGIKFATHETQGPLSTLTVVVNAGPSRETSDYIGVSHFLKHFGFKSTLHQSNIRIVRESEHFGMALKTTIDREHVIYTLDFMRNELPLAVGMISDVLKTTRFRPWEIRDIAEIVNEETHHALSDPLTVVSENLHRAAFQSSLGNSLFADEATTAEMSSPLLHEYHGRQYVAGNVFIAAANVNANDLKVYGNNAFYNYRPGAFKPAPPANYVGGDVRVPSWRSPVNYYAFAVEGVASSHPDYAASLVVRNLLGGESSTKWGEGQDTLAKIAAAHPNTKANAFSLNYATSGLLGVLIQGPAKEIPKTATEAAAAFKRLGSEVSANALQAAKNEAKRTVLSTYETREGATTDLGRQLSTGSALSKPAQIAAAIDALTADDVKRVVKAALKTKPTAVVIGDVLTAPYGSQLQL